MFNRIVLMGRVTKDPELRMTASNIPVVTVSVAVDRSFSRQGEQRETDFFDVTAFRNTAEFASKWFRKGMLIIAEGRLQTRKWKDKFDQNRVSYEIVADNLFFGETRSSFESRQAPGGYEPAESPYAPSYDKPAQQSPSAPPAYQQARTAPPLTDFKELADDDDVPF